MEPSYFAELDECQKAADSLLQETESHPDGSPLHEPRLQEIKSIRQILNLLLKNPDLDLLKEQKERINHLLQFPHSAGNHAVSVSGEFDPAMLELRIAENIA